MGRGEAGSVFLYINIIRKKREDAMGKPLIQFLGRQCCSAEAGKRQPALKLGRHWLKGEGQVRSD